MLLRVSCRGCRLSPAWTDDPDGLLGTVCNRPFRCGARVDDEQSNDVTAGYMDDRHHAFYALAAEPAGMSVPEHRIHRIFGRPPSRAWIVATISCLAALLVCHEMMSAYEGASLVGIGFALGIPLAALLFGRTLAPDALDWRVASLSFFVALPVLLTIAFPSALQAAREADARLIGSLVSRTRADEGSLVIDRLDPGLAEKAKQRVAVRAGGRTYDLADASTRKQGKRSPDRRVTLVVDLKGTPEPHEVEFEGLRGPTTTFSEMVALAK